MPTHELIAYGGTGLGYSSLVGDRFVANTGQIAHVVARDANAILDGWIMRVNSGGANSDRTIRERQSEVISSEISWLAAGDRITSGCWIRLSYSHPETGLKGTIESYLVFNATTTDWGGRNASYVVTDQRLMDGVTYTVAGIEYSAEAPWNALKCFVRGTRIRTPEGAVRVEDLSVGDLVHTKDNGPQPIRWMGRRRIEAEGRFAPVRIKTGVLGNRRPLLLSPSHCILLRGVYAELLFAENEVLVPAKYLRHHRGVRLRQGGMVQYYHMLFDRHEIVYAEGVPVESFHPGEQVMTGLSQEAREEIFTLFPDLRKGAPRFECTHKSLSRAEAAAIPALH